MTFKISICDECGRLHYVGMYNMNGDIYDKLWLISSILQVNCYSHGSTLTKEL